MEYIINTFKPFIESTSKNIFIPSLDKEDIRQELILSLLKAIDKYKGNNNFFWYGISSMRNNIYTILRKNKKLENEKELKDIHKEEFNIDNNLFKEEDKKYLKALLKNLDKQEYNIIFKSFFLDYTYEDLIKETNLKYSTIACKKSRALKKLRDYVRR